MVDQFQTPSDPTQPAPVEPSPEKKSSADELKSFFSTTTGKIILGVAGAAALLAILGVVAFFVLGGMGTGGSSDLATTPSPSTSTPPQTGGTSAEASATIEEPEAVAIADVYTFRDIFAPTVKPTVVSTSSADSSTPSTEGPSGGSSSGGSSSGGSSSGGSSASKDDDTLYLEDIVSEDGTQVAVFTYNGTEYKLTEGERVGDTPWKVLSIGENSVLMLYGDTQVTLSVGQGLTK